MTMSSLSIFSRSFDVTKEDILFGRGAACYNHPGNVAFREMMHVQMMKYSISVPRSLKSKIIISVIANVKEQGRRFMVWNVDDCTWIEIEAQPQLIRSKVSHALRDARCCVTRSK